MRRSVKDVYNQLGRKTFRRAYRINLATFYSLYTRIRQPLWNVCGYNPETKNQKYPFVHNGSIHPTVRLACAIRLYSGGEAVDIACTYIISPTEVHNSFLQVIKATNSVDSLKLKFPKSHEEQYKVAEGFKKLSKRVSRIEKVTIPTRIKHI